MVLFLIYVVLGYWATGRTIYANKVLIGSSNAIMAKKMGMGIAFGWALIPVAVFRLIFHR